MQTSRDKNTLDGIKKADQTLKNNSEHKDITIEIIKIETE